MVGRWCRERADGWPDGCRKVRPADANRLGVRPGIEDDVGLASQRDVRNKIASVKNIQKITRAMEMVAAARLRRAEQRIDAGTYGYSIRSGQAISDERLEADPAAELTVAEAQTP